MSATERDRLDVFGRVKRGEVTVVAAAGLLGLSVRQAPRAWKRFKGSGAAGLVHGLRGRASNRALSAADAARAVKLHQELYGDFGPTLACEKLAADHELTNSPDMLTALLKSRGLWVRRRKRGRHRSRRERRASLGSLVQVDGSPHDWFEGRGPKCVLMVAIDDATSRTLARFYESETTVAAFDVFGRWVGAMGGVPRASYVDRHSIYRDEDHPERPTQFGRAMRELTVELHPERSRRAAGASAGWPGGRATCHAAAVVAGPVPRCVQLVPTPRRSAGRGTRPSMAAGLAPRCGRRRHAAHQVHHDEVGRQVRADEPAKLPTPAGPARGRRKGLPTPSGTTTPRAACGKVLRPHRG